MSNIPYGPGRPYDTSPNPNFPNNRPATSSFPWGCLLFGCLGVMLFGIVIVAGASYSVWRFYKNQIASYTSDQPLNIPTVEATEQQVKALEKRFDDFRTQVDAGEVAQELVITAEEVNMLLSKDPSMKGRVFIKLEDGTVRADVSIPLEGLPGASGRYFNGSITLQLEIEDGQLFADVVAAEANGQPVPEQVLVSLQEEDFTRGIKRDPEISKILKRCESLEVQSDRMVLKIRPKRNGQLDGTEPETTAESDSQSNLEYNPVPEDQGLKTTPNQN